MVAGSYAVHAQNSYCLYTRAMSPIGSARGEFALNLGRLEFLRSTRVAGSSGAAAKLGVPPSTLDHRIKALGIGKTQFKFR